MRSEIVKSLDSIFISSVLYDGVDISMVSKYQVHWDHEGTIYKLRLIDEDEGNKKYDIKITLKPNSIFILDVDACEAIADIRYEDLENIEMIFDALVRYVR